MIKNDVKLSNSSIHLMMVSSAIISNAYIFTNTRPIQVQLSQMKFFTNMIDSRAVISNETVFIHIIMNNSSAVVWNWNIFMPCLCTHSNLLALSPFQDIFHAYWFTCKHILQLMKKLTLNTKVNLLSNLEWFKFIKLQG